jgi:CS domain
MQKISTYNGDSTDKYNWSQSITEVNVQIPIPIGTKAKDLEVKIETKKLLVKLKNQTDPIISGELQEKVKVEDSFWNVEDS